VPCARHAPHVSDCNMSEFSHPLTHTGVIQSSVHSLDKLWWNYQVYEHQLSVPGIGDEQGYAVIDFAIASSTVHAWVCAEYCEAVERVELDPYLGPADGVSEVLRGRVRWWNELRAVGNATKHRRLQHRYWPSGVNKPTLQGDVGDMFEGVDDEEGFRRFIAKINSGELWYESAFINRETGHSVLAKAALLENYSDWHSIVVELREALASTQS
jgi:hypothetical protein